MKEHLAAQIHVALSTISQAYAVKDTHTRKAVALLIRACKMLEAQQAMPKELKEDVRTLLRGIKKDDAMLGFDVTRPSLFVRIP